MRLMPVSLASAFVVVAALTARPVAASTCMGFTIPTYPEHGGELPQGETLVLYERTCNRVPAADRPRVSIEVADLSVKVDDRPASLVPDPRFDGRFAWVIEPPPPVGAQVVVTGCDKAQLVAGQCGPATATTADVDGPALQWSFTVTDPAPAPTLLAPVLDEFLGEIITEDPLLEDGVTRWTLGLERAANDSGRPMLLDVELRSGLEFRRTLAWTSSQTQTEIVEFVGRTAASACVTVRTFDLHGNAGPTAEQCGRAEPEAGCSCRTGHRGPLGAWILGLAGFVLVRRRVPK